MDKLTLLESLNLEHNLSYAWRRWKQHFKIFLSAITLSKKDKRVKEATISVPFSNSKIISPIKRLVCATFYGGYDFMS